MYLLCESMYVCYVWVCVLCVSVYVCVQILGCMDGCEGVGVRVWVWV